jgi:hypothetical protein
MALWGFLFSAVPVFAYSQYNSGTAVNSSSGAGTSYNWSGYVASGGSFTSVGSSWNISPAISPSANTAEATWIGIGGVTSSDLIQVGTQTIINSSEQIVYQAFYEILPSDSVIIPVTINPGDSVTATVSQQSAGQWNIYFIDNNNGQSYQASLQYSSSLSSAEWIEEMPTDASTNSFIPINNFGTRQFYNASTTKNGFSENLLNAGAQELTMINISGQALVSTSAIGSDGASFTATRTSAVPTISVSTFGRGNWRRVGRGISGFAFRKTSYLNIRRGVGRRFIMSRFF